MPGGCIVLKLCAGDAVGEPRESSVLAGLSRLVNK